MVVTSFFIFYFFCQKVSTAYLPPIHKNDMNPTGSSTESLLTFTEKFSAAFRVIYEWYNNFDYFEFDGSFRLKPLDYTQVDLHTTNSLPDY